MKSFIIKHKLSILVISFTILFFITFLYIDLAEVMFYSSLEGNMTSGIIKRSWFFLIPTILLIPFIIVFLIKYLINYKKKKKWIIFPLVLVFELIYTFYVSLYFMAPGFSFFPTTLNDEILNYDNVYEVSVNMDDKTYKSLYYDNNKSECAIFFLGNGMVSSDIFEILGNDKLKTSNKNILVMDYPIFRNNPGGLTENNIYKLVDLHMDLLINELGYDLSHISVYGFSIGTGVACYCAEKYEVKALTLFAPYHKFEVCMNVVTPIFYGPNKLCVRFKFNSIERAKNIKCHTKIIFSEADKVIPFYSTYLLADEFKDKELIPLANASHAMVLRGQLYNYLCR